MIQIAGKTLTLTTQSGFPAILSSCGQTLERLIILLELHVELMYQVFACRLAYISRYLHTMSATCPIVSWDYHTSNLLQLYVGKSRGILPWLGLVI
jgi:hypothetical protein